MFFPGTDPSQDSSAVVLIPTRIVWPYGGKSVFVTGTFTRSEHVPMSPVEGCPNVFQAICGVAPGLHQYKFYVDGEWRHDEHQPYVTGTYGIVNTLLLTRDPELIPPILSPGRPGNRTIMEVDNETIRPVVYDDWRLTRLIMFGKFVYCLPVRVHIFEHFFVILTSNILTLCLLFWVVEFYPAATTRLMPGVTVMLAACIMEDAHFSRKDGSNNLNMNLFRIYAVGGTLFCKIAIISYFAVLLHQFGDSVWWCHAGGSFEDFRGGCRDFSTSYFFVLVKSYFL